MWTRPTGPTVYPTTTSEDSPPVFWAPLWLPAPVIWEPGCPPDSETAPNPWPSFLAPHPSCRQQTPVHLDFDVRWPQTLVASLGYWQMPAGLWLAEASCGCGLACNNVCWNDFISHTGWALKVLLEISFLELWLFPRNNVYKVATLLGQRQNPIATGRHRETAAPDSHL